MIRFTKDLITSCESLAQAIHENPNLVGMLSMMAHDDMLRIVDKINHEEHFLSYIENINNQNIVSIFTDIDTLNRIRESIELTWKSRFDKAQIRNNEILELMNSVIEEINEIQTTRDIFEPQLLPIYLIQRDFEMKSSDHSMNFNFMRIELFEKLRHHISTTDPSKYPYLMNLYHKSVKGANYCAQLIASNKTFADELMNVNADVKKLCERIEKQRKPLSGFIIGLSLTPNPRFVSPQAHQP